jgi:hypothetical protein
MAAFFLLMSSYVVPDEGNREAFFAQLEMIDKKGNGREEGSLKWYQVQKSFKSYCEKLKMLTQSLEAVFWGLPVLTSQYSRMDCYCHILGRWDILRYLK